MGLVMIDLSNKRILFWALFVCFLAAKSCAETLPPVRSFETIAGDTMIQLRWSAPLEKKIVAWMIRRSDKTYPQTPQEGDLVYLGNGIHLLNVKCDRGLKNGQTYFYSIFSVGDSYTYSAPVHAQATCQKQKAAFNHIRNGAFNFKFHSWKKNTPGNFETSPLALFPKQHYLEIRGEPGKEVSISQKTLPTLKPKTLYTCACAVYAYGSTAHFSVEGGIQNEQQASDCCPLKYGFGPIVNKGNAQQDEMFWQERRFVFWTGDLQHPTAPFRGAVTLTLSCHPLEGKDTFARFANIRIVEGVMPMIDTALDPQHPLVLPGDAASGLPFFETLGSEWTFEKGLDPDSWLILDKMGSDPKNISTDKEGNLVLTAWGKQSKENPLTGAVLFSKKEFGSGRFDMWAQIGPVYNEEDKAVPESLFQGASFTFWTFHFQHYLDGQPQWYDDPSPIRNSEIDWEMPGDYPKGARAPIFPYCPLISWKNSRFSAWGGQRGGEEEGNVTMHVPFPSQIDVRDGAFHQYTFVWHSGFEKENGRRDPGYIEWYFDTGEELNPNNRVAKWVGDDYGFDNIPDVAGNIAFSTWFPITKGGYGPQTCLEDGWAGSSNWLRAEFKIKKVRYTPFSHTHKPNRDRWEAKSPLKFWDALKIKGRKAANGIYIFGIS